MNKQIEYDMKCGIAIDFIANEEFRKEILSKSSLDELSVELCYKNKDKFYKDLQNLKYPKELEKFLKGDFK